jgi:hypothetical protein
VLAFTTWTADAECARRSLQIFGKNVRIGVCRIDESGDYACFRHHFVDEIKAFCCQFDVENSNAGDVSAGPIQAFDNAHSHRIEAGEKNDRDRRGGCLGGQDRRCVHRDHGHLSLNQIGRQRRQSIVLAVGPAIFDRHVPAFDKARFAQTLTKCLSEVRIQFGRFTVEKADHGHRRLLRAGGERASGRAADEREKGTASETAHRGTTSWFPTPLWGGVRGGGRA